MEKPFRPIPLEKLARWIFRELDGQGPVLGIPRENFEVPDPKMAVSVHGHPLAAPLGMAAGPHTQLAQNIVAGWLCGARFIELKTVQVLDEIHVSRPCIDAQDATYNCEWSQELTLGQSFDEYLKAWVLLHAIAHRLGLQNPGALFAMSVGYNLEGIQSQKVQAFLKDMRHAGGKLKAAVEEVAQAYPAVRDLAIPFELSDHITLSTMHGCPPAEIERIARYLLTELGVHTWVKLNPTLLGPERLRGILNRTLGHDIEVPDLAFEHDPRFEDALAMVKSLAETAKGRPQRFGIKLSNTLEVVNRRRVFPPNEKMMYLSGRALHPLTLNLAELVTEATGGEVPISFCGGADSGNFADLVADGLGPVTVCTDLLKPGGYARLQQYLVNLEAAMVRAEAESVEEFQEKLGGARESLSRHAARVLGESRWASRERPLETKGHRALGWFDCIAAPCQEACPSHQNIPDYLWHVAHGEPQAALDVILRTNPMPAVTGSVCDHPCTEHCVRNHYDLPLAIREIKRFAVENAQAKVPEKAALKDVKVAIVGAGPMGLSAAWYLAKAGFAVTVLEARKELGGMVSGVIPAYRLGDRTIEQDVARVRALGVEIQLGKRLGKDFSLADLRRDFRYVVLAIGAAAGKKLGIPGEASQGVLDALSFLEKARSDRGMDLGKRVLVIGAGNSAMDAARTARRMVKDGAVDLVYRRTRAQMPADPQEVVACVEEGIGIKDLLAPLRVEAKDGKAVALVCGRMKLGEPDASGRPRPVATGEEVALPCDTVIAAISQEPVMDFLGGVEIARNKDGSLRTDPKTFETSLAGLFAGGDLTRGPSSVIQAIADGRAAAEEICRRHGAPVTEEPWLPKQRSQAQLMEKKARRSTPQTVPVLPVAQRGGFDEVLGSFSAEAAAIEASRCLDCDEVCSLCVTVCPNRANRSYLVAPLATQVPAFALQGGKLAPRPAGRFEVGQSVQIVNLGDACNECGNCNTFCPTAGAPYKQKPKFWLDAAGFEEWKGDAFRLTREGDKLELVARLGGELHVLTRRSEGLAYSGPKLKASWSGADLASARVEPGPGLAEGEAADLSTAAALLPLLSAEAEVAPA